MPDVRQVLNALQAASNTVASNVSAPVDLLAWALRKGGVPVPKNALGSSDWMADRGLTAPVAQGPGQVLGDTLGMVAPMAVAAKAPQIANALLKVGENAATPKALNNQLGALVWHGSPHKFDKFDTSKIGTGEGAQAYGHGLYLAESPDVAKSYQTMLSGRTDAAAALYKVDLPDEKIARMLDWDKPLSQQAPEVRAALSKTAIAEANPNATGAEIYQWLSDIKGGRQYAPSHLKQQGIPGIRYLDGGSRGTGTGTSNYVVFPGEENALQILERNGVPLKR